MNAFLLSAATTTTLMAGFAAAQPLVPRSLPTFTPSPAPTLTTTEVMGPSGEGEGSGGLPDLCAELQSEYKCTKFGHFGCTWNGSSCSRAGGEGSLPAPPGPGGKTPSP